MLQPETTSSTAKYAPMMGVLIVLIVFCRLFPAEFTFWDDQMTIADNLLFRADRPLSDPLHYYWSTPTQGLYVPVTYTVWTLLSRIAVLGMPDPYGFSLNSWVYHALNVLTHAGSTLLVLRLLGRLVGRGWPAFLGAMLFALHPLQVEAVGWASGFKDLLCWFLSLAMLAVYLPAADSRREGGSAWKGWRLPVALLLLIAAILSKPTAIVAPAVAFTLDALLVRPNRRRQAILDVAPFLVLSIIGAFLARDAQYIFHIKAAPLWHRPFVAGDAYAFYLAKFAWPATLTFDYGRTPQVVMAWPTIYFHWLLPVAVLAACLWAWLARGVATPLAGFLVYGLAIAPVSGLATFQMQAFSTVTDHYAYLALFGAGLVLAWAVRKWPAARGLALVAIACLGIRTFVQTGHWRNSFTLFEAGMAARPDDAYVAPSNLAYTYFALGRPDEGERYADLAFSRNPDSFPVLNSYVATKFALGKDDEALAQIDKIREHLQTGYYGPQETGRISAGIAISTLRAGDLDRALTWAEDAFAAAPDMPAAQSALLEVRMGIADRDRQKAASTTTPAPASRPK